MPRLLDRQHQIPNGFQFSLPEVGYKSAWYASFDTIVNSVESVIKANHDLAVKYGWPTQRADIADWIDQYNAALCQINGWTQFITGIGEPAPPFTVPPPEEKNRLDAAAGIVRKIWSGVKTLDEWINSGEPAASPPLAEERAAICAACPRNGAGDFTKWFTIPAAAIIKRQQAKLAQRTLATTHDGKLGVCEVCLCPMKLKVHIPPPYLRSTDAETLKELSAVPGCWIPKELS